MQFNDDPEWVRFGAMSVFRFQSVGSSSRWVLAALLTGVGLCLVVLGTVAQPNVEQVSYVTVSSENEINPRTSAEALGSSQSRLAGHLRIFSLEAFREASDGASANSLTVTEVVPGLVEFRVVSKSVDAAAQTLLEAEKDFSALLARVEARALPRNKLQVVSSELGAPHGDFERKTLVVGLGVTSMGLGLGLVLFAVLMGRKPRI